MKHYKGIVLFKYYQEIEVQAESREDAERAMYERFDIGKADGESELYDLEEINEE